MKRARARAARTKATVMRVAGDKEAMTTVARVMATATRVAGKQRQQQQRG
jgi:hypothetical protein